MKITYENEVYDVPQGLTIKGALKEQIENSSIKDIIAIRFNNTIESLNMLVEQDGTVEFINREDKDGRIIYIRGLLFILSKAFKELYPEAKLNVNYQLSNSMFGRIDNMEITDEIVENVKVKMHEIVDKDLPIIKVIMTQEEAEEFYKNENTIRGKMQTQIDKDTVSLYFCEDYYNYFYGTMPISTGFAKVFDFVKYRNGFLVKYPSLIEPDILQPHATTSLKIISAMDEYDEINRLLKINTVYRLNKKIDEPNGQKELVLLSEALHEKKIAEIANKIKEHGNVRMVLIAGPSSSGKQLLLEN